MKRPNSFALVLVAITLCAAAFSQDAPMFRGNLQHTGVYSAPGAPAFNGLRWKFSANGRVISSPAIVNGIAYVGSTDGNLYAVDTSSGSLKWKFATNSWIVSSPAVSNGVVFFLSYDSNFYAVDAVTGQLKWKFQTGGEKRFAGTHLHHLLPAAESMPDPWDFFLSSAAVWNGTVYFGSSDGNIYALDSNSGKLKWKFHTADVVHSSPAIANGILYIGSWDSYLYALDAASGQEKWRFKTGDDPEFHNHVGIQSSPAVVDGVVYFGSRDSFAYAVDAATGKQLWKAGTNGSWVNNSPAVYDGKAYFGSSVPGFLYVVDAKTGITLYQLPTGSPIFSSITIAGSTLYIGNFAGKLSAIDLKTQKANWSFETDAAKINAPGLTNPDGSVKWEELLPRSPFYDDMVLLVNGLFTMGTFLSSPVVVGDTLYIGSTDGNLYAIH